MIRDGYSHDEVCRRTRLSRPEVERLAGELSGRKRDPLHTAMSVPIREAVAAMPVKAAVHRRREEWTAHDDARLAELAGAFTHAEIAAKMCRSVGAVSNRVMHLDLTAPRGLQNNKLLRALYQARYYLRRDARAHALEVIEGAIKSHGGKP